MQWHKCSESMPGQEDDIGLNKELSLLDHAGFVVCYNHGDHLGFLARCYLKNGRFILDESCHWYDEKGECPDKFQETYWDEDIVVTHWMHLEWPDEILEDCEHE